MKKLYRSRRDSKLFGLCGGLAEYLNVDSTILRLVVVITAFFSGGTVIPIYIIASLVIPKEPELPPMYPPQSHYPGGRGMYQGSYQYGGHDPRYRPSYNGSHGNGYYGTGTKTPPPPPQEESQLDEMMKDIEKKALWKEIQELRAKVEKYEQELKENKKGDQ